MPGYLKGCSHNLSKDGLATHNMSHIWSPVLVVRSIWSIGIKIIQEETRHNELSFIRDLSKSKSD